MLRWTDEQDAALRKLVNKNLINYTNLELNYLFEVTQEYFPISSGQAQVQEILPSSAFARSFGN